MRILTLPTLWTILLDALAWLILQPTIGYLATQIPWTAFDHEAWLYRTRPWERGGALYDVLGVRRWKRRLPSGGTVFGGFSMRQFSSAEADYVARWLAETCRAELAHWLQIAVAPLFFLWNPPVAGVIILAYALVINLPCIVVQRHNRPRLVRILAARRR